MSSKGAADRWGRLQQGGAWFEVSSELSRLVKFLTLERKVERNNFKHDYQQTKNWLKVPCKRKTQLIIDVTISKSIFELRVTQNFNAANAERKTAAARHIFRWIFRYAEWWVCFVR